MPVKKRAHTNEGMIDQALFKLPGVRAALAVLAVFALAQAACVLVQSFALALAIARFWSGAALTDELHLVGAFAIGFVVNQVIGTCRSVFIERYAAARAHAIRTRLTHAAFSSSGTMMADGTGGLVSSLLEGTDQIETYLSLILPKAVNLAIVPLACLVASFACDAVSGILLLAAFPAIVLFMVLIGSTAQERARTRYESYRMLANSFIDTLRGLPTLAAFGAAQRQEGVVRETSERFRATAVRTLTIATLSGAVLDLIATLAVAAVAMLAALRLMHGTLGLEQALICLVLAPEFFKPIREFAGDFHASLDGRTALARAGAQLAIGHKPSTTHDAPSVSWSASSELSFENVDFSYPAAHAEPRSSAERKAQAAAMVEARPEEGRADETPALKGASFTLSGFERVALIGPSGAGKSTLAQLVGGFSGPARGCVRLDGAPVSLACDAWRKNVIYIPQNPHIFHASLRENLAFYKPDASPAEIDEALHISGLNALASSLPRGIDTQIGEGARTLSGGQAQRVALARAFLLPERRVLVFDEPTAHLDIETELELRERMVSLMEGRLVVFATHRLHWLDCMQRALVVRDGRIVFDGPASDLRDEPTGRVS